MWIRITVCGRTYGLIEIKINLRLTIDYVRQFILWRQYVCKSSKIVIEARTEASSRRAFIGYIFIHERSSTETNDFTLLLFPSFFFLSPFPIYRFDFRCENASFSALKRLIESSNFKIDPRTNTPRRRNRDRERTRSEKKMGKHREISFISSLHYTRQSFSTVSQKWTFPFQRHPNDDKKKNHRAFTMIKHFIQILSIRTISSYRKCLPLIDIHVTWEYLLGQCVSTFSALDRSLIRRKQ